ncbi:tail fiber domain-containing protein [Brevibacterium casei]
MIRVDYDGKFADYGEQVDVTATQDLDRVEVHASQDPNFVPDRVVSYGGAYASLEGGSFTLGPLADAGTWYVRLVARSKAGKFSVPSDLVEVEVAVAGIDLEITNAWLTGEAAQTTADGKNAIFRGPDEPVNDPDNPFKVGDIWFEMTEDGKSIPNQWDGSQWTGVDDYRQSQIEKVQEELRKDLDAVIVDGSGRKNFYQSEEPAEGMSEGDLWFDTDDHDKPHIYASGEWSPISRLVTESEIANGAISTPKLATGAITAESGIIGSINAGTITVGEMDGARIKAGTIAADKVLVGGLAGNLLVNPDFVQGLAGWTAAGGASLTQASTGPQVLLPDANSSITSAPVKPNGSVGVRAVAESGFTLIRAIGTTTSGAVETQAVSIKATRTDAATGFNVFEGTFTPPASWVSMQVQVGVLPIFGGGTSANKIASVGLFNQVGATLIQDGAVITSKIATGAITAESGIIGSIDANTITVGKIMGNQLDADAVNGKTITGATIRTASSGARVELTQNGLRQYNALNAVLVDMTSGSFSVTGGSITGSTIKTAASGARVELTTTGLKQYSASGALVTDMSAGSMVLAGDMAVNTGRILVKGSGTTSDGKNLLELRSGGHTSAAGEDFQSPGMFFTPDPIYGAEQAAIELRTFVNEPKLILSSLPKIVSSTVKRYGMVELASAGASLGYRERTQTTTGIGYGWRSVVSAFDGVISMTAREGIYMFPTANTELKIEPNNNLSAKLAGINWMPPNGSSSDTIVRVTGAGWLVKQGTSSRRFKTDIEPLESDDRLLDVQPITFHYAEQKQEFEAGPDTWSETNKDVFANGLPLHRGVIAEDLEEMGLTHLVGHDSDGDPYSVAYDQMGFELIPIVARLRDRINDLENRLAAVEAA